MLAILFFVSALLFFIDFAGKIPQGVHALLHLQIVPAILSGAVGIMAFQFILVLVFGRLYCSAICPAGILQDAINRLFCIGKKKSKGVRRFSFRKPQNLLRYLLLGATAATALAGFTTLLVWLDPYSNFGRIAANLFRPVTMWGNNVLADLLTRMDNYALYHVTVHTVTTAGLLAGLLALLLFVGLTIFRGRLFCNTLCPVGALLSLISRYSFFRISFDEQLCNRCGNCERTCKAEAINSKQMTVDTSRCVDCFNCTSSCTKSSLKYRFRPPFASGKPSAEKPSSGKPAEAPAAGKLSSEAPAASPSNGRRRFFATGATVAATLPVLSTVAQYADLPEGEKPTEADNIDYERLPPVTPPGSAGLERFKDQCTGCHLCVVRCPTQVLRPAGLQFGFDYLLRPYCKFESSYCNYECTVCGEVCPVHAIRGLSKEEKRTTQVGVATFNISRCIVHTEGTDCGACSEHCPTQAVHMIPYEGTLTIPQVESELCIGCGGCESICPVRPYRAIVVVANREHAYVAPPEEEEVKEIEIDGFGF
ncbi:MAG: 4Fe-4S binding protein [Tannerellaceae bacterium]|nr:4Fe-4S binding protein [Tannerellaceae bacterium]